MLLKDTITNTEQNVTKLLGLSGLRERNEKLNGENYMNEKSTFY
jgi:hypothetical protein